uniref:Pirin N-terminal domain-containing protein n=1 Tax=Lotharella globosa TaxID=91324 RepID=A0A6V3IYH2_9EUKA|mmetsp:Transcript_3265/g.6430  ORF Transcript_3265/g.6430 Transcript_3265/m.6430 type:complete len:276 (-) Transcript_3265:143-970(-)|eukprot:CAMPEP_0167780380 /NCGR_PEP_ID=MMETSP0111_2-20121227/5323_1 /TAXON_ID=91324 /ORGANISM="Lotharella globosa, Strain CCCM811" /LENGTH=275 /DNA_ID=CAMNT_0007670881 /DNA_START=41 /DNA_END=868 /DNA_ORIENTATION=+
MQARKKLRYIPNKMLAVSEPNPMWFGNKANEPNNPKWTNKNWLKSRFHFSFAEYSNYENTNFGVLRVMNDDLVQPRRGFGSHPHRNAEIVTYVVQGKLTHQDSMGTKESLGRGSIQFMTAGTGVVHSEHNLDDEPLRFIQMWLTPERSGLKPNYGSMCGSKIDSKNRWGHLVSSTSSKASTPVKIHCDANIFSAELSDEKATLDLDLAEGRQAYFLAVEGSPTISGKFGSQKLVQHDAAELSGGESFKITGPGHVLLVEMKDDGRGGRGDFEDYE